MFLPLFFLSLFLPFLSTTEVYLVFNDLSVASGQQATFSCSVNSGPEHTITHVAITDPSNNTLQISTQGAAYLASIISTDYSHTGVYTCTVTLTDNVQGVTEVFTNTALLTVYLPAVILQSPQTGVYFVDVPFSIFCRVEGFPTPQITWLIDGSTLSTNGMTITDMTTPPFTNSTLTFLSPDESQSAGYSCRANNMYTLDDTDIMNEDISSVASILIRPLPIVTRLEDRNVTIQNMATIVCEASGEQPLYFSWYNLTVSNTSLNTDSEITIENFVTSSELRIHSAERKHTGNYQCIVSNVDGGSSAQMFLLVQEVPSPPEDIISEVQARTVTLSWSISFDGNSPITLSIIEMGTDGVFAQVATQAGDVTENTLTGLTPYTSYTFRVIIQNMIGTSIPSLPLTVTTLEDQPDTAPRNVLVSEVTADNVKISWSAPEPHGWNGLITSFMIEYTLLLTVEEGGNVVDSISSTLTIPLIPSQSDHSFNTRVYELEAYQNYSLRVSACTTVGCGVYSQPEYTLTSGSIPTRGPTILYSDVVVTSETIQLQWNVIELRHRNGVILSYTILYTTADEKDVTLSTGSSMREFTITGLSPYTLYRISIAGETSGVGPYGAVMEVITGEAEPSEPRDVTIVYLSYTELSVSWNTPLNPNGIITLYTLYYTQVSSNLTQSVTTTTPPLILSGLTNFTVRIKVSASTVVGEGTPSQVVEAAPATPPKIEGVDVTSNDSQTRSVNRIQVFLGATLTLACSIHGTPTPDYSWSANYTGNGYFDLLAREQTYTLANIRAEQSGGFICVAENIFGSANLSFIVSVVEFPLVQLLYSVPEFCTSSGDAIHCERSKVISLSLSCSFTNGVPTPVLSFTREGTALAQGPFGIQITLSDENTRLYMCEAVNAVGSHTQSLFINLVGTFSIEVTTGGVVTWSLADTGYLEGDFVFEYGVQNISENYVVIQNVSTLVLSDIISVPGYYRWRVKFVTSYGDTVISDSYFYSNAEPVAMEWLYGLLGFLVILVLVIFVIVIILAVLYCYRRRHQSKDCSEDLFTVPSRPIIPVKPLRTLGLGTEGVLDGTVDNTVPKPRPKKRKFKRDSFNQPEDYLKNQAYRGPMAFHNQALESDLKYSQKSSFHAASNFKFLGQKRNEPVGMVGFKRVGTPDFPLPPPPPTDNTSFQSHSPDDTNLTPPPPPVPDPTYSS